MSYEHEKNIALIFGSLFLVLLTYRVVLSEYANEYTCVDSIIYSTVTSAWRSGAVLYKDIIDNKPPGIYFLFRLAQSADDISPRRIWQAIDLLVGAAAIMIFLGFAAQRKFFAGFMAALALLFIWGPQNPLNLKMLNTEAPSICMWFIALALALIYNRSQCAWTIRLCGAFTAIAFLFKHPGIYIALPCCALILAQPFHDSDETYARLPFSRRIACLLPFVSGALAVVAAVVLYFAWHNALGDFLDWSFVRNLYYAGKFSCSAKGRVIGIFWDHIQSNMEANKAAVFLAAIPLAAALLFIRRRLLDLVWVLLLLSVIASALTANHFYWHYAIYLIPLVVFSFALVWDYLIGYRPIFKEHPLVQLLFGALLFALINAPQIMPFTKALFTEPPVATIPFRSAAQDLGNRMKSAAQPNDTLFVWAGYPEFYLLSSIKPASRFVYAPGNEFQEAENLKSREVFATKPSFILIPKNDYEKIQAAEKGEGVLDRFFFSKHYEIWAQEDAWVVLKKFR